MYWLLELLHLISSVLSGDLGAADVLAAEVVPAALTVELANMV